MNGIDDVIASFTARQHGLIARWQALGAGINADQVKDRITRGRLVPVHPGVYRLRGVHTGLDIITINKIPVTTRARAMLDCAAVLPLSVLELLVQDAVSRGLLEVEHLMAIVDRRGGRGVDGTVNLRLALENGLVDDKIESKLELIVARIIDPLPIPKPVRQFELTCDDGREVRLDNAWPDIKVAVEADGRRWHGNKYQATKTRARGRSITATGWDHYVYGWSEATETPLDVRLEVERAVLGPMRGGGFKRPSRREAR